ncbi:type IV secretory system conjugative DNA transfer family protein, partial [Helicobacter pylori]|uniref:type IV secretory system conjugative DNA transfer family protein n=1 Tax=Helicobacter pylori TaxID=210 RepID=UPI001E619618
MSFNYEELRTDSISLYIVIAQKDINTLAPLVRVILESIAKNLLTNESSKKEERIYMILDEFVRFGKLPFLLEMPALCRSYNVVPLFITQDYAMIRKYYSDDDLKILKGVVHYNIVFKMNSAEDAEIVSKEVGEFTRQSKNYSTEKGQLVFGGSSSYSHEGRNLLTAQDIMNIESDEVIVIVTGAKATPLKLKANYWFKDKELLKRANLPIDLEVERKRVEEPTQPTTEITTPPNQNKQDTANLEPSNNGEYTENESSESNNENNPTTPQKESENSNPTESEKDHENPTTSQEKSKNENTEQENDETDEILKKPLNEMNTEEKRALFKMAYKPSKKKLQTLREEPNLFSILDNGDIATNNLVEETDKVNETQDPLPYVVKTQINRASMISRNPIEWARYLSFEKRIYKDNSREDVNFFANGEIKESSRIYEANEEGFERRITKRYDLIDTIKNREFFSREIEILTYTNSLEELKEQGLEIQLTHHHETHKKTLENGNEIVKEYDYLKDIYQEVERTKDNELVREIIPSISSTEYFKLYNKLPFESINNENTKLNTNDNEEVKKLEFELAKEVHTLILEQQLLSATN